VPVHVAGKPRRHRLALPLLAAVAMAACSPPPATVERAPPPPAATRVPPVDVPPDAETPPATLGCDPAPVQSLLGQVATAELQSRARAAAGADSVRMLVPGQAASTDYRAGRLNLQQDAANRLTRAYCG
jgi:hypothetical protein